MHTTMFPSFKKYKRIFVIILILIISAVILLYRYNKSTPPDSLSFKVTNTPNSEKPLIAAILLLTPVAGQFYVGDIVKVSLLVNVLDQPVNVVDGKITFPSDKLEVINVSKDGSVVSLWVQEPIASSGQDFIAFSGGLPAPGFTGIAGQIMTVAFKVKSQGDAEVGLEDAHVLANDGIGTDILVETTPARLTLLKPEIKKTISDINKDGKVDLVDVSIILNNWGIPKNQKADLNEDGRVDAKDFSILLSRWSH